ncbi:MAG TPA: cytochrome d ubiquinol oxidase subunit II [Xanthobacteraceae bacterium]|nr:cytochrome d ubiquinol oxidase subunit II [Xanthobacteraceae bacterium]
MEWYLPVIWATLIGAAVALYVILDGFDLGIGILFPLAAGERDRDQMINSIAPFWDGNETWLVLGGGGLWVAFPRAYAVVMPALYLPVIVMLLGLIFRGVAFEFRTVANTSKKYWTFAFAGGSTLAAFCQGLILGGLIQGIRVESGAFAGQAFDFATPFAAVCGLGVVTGYALLGACWLAMKTEGAVAARARAHAKLLLLGVLVFMGIVSLWTPLQFPRIAQRWFSLPNILFLWPVPAITLLTAYLAWRWLEAGREVRPFLAAIALFMLGYLGLAISIAPYLVPPSITFWDAAAAPASQIFMLLGTLPLLPIILIYTGFLYYLFRGKTRAGEGYH